MEYRRHQGEKATMTGSQGRARLSTVVESPWLMVLVVVLAATLLSLGITRDYRLKHEDNNALHTTFAHSHQKAGLSITKGHDAYINARNDKVTFYGHHPPGVGLLLAGVFSLSGHDGPVVVRGVAIVATLLMLVSVWWIVRREVGAAPALVAALSLALIPQAAFYGRMVNHEILALPVMVIMVDRYFALARGGGWLAGAVLGIAALVGALLAWVTFFALAGCVLHSLLARRKPSTFPAAGQAFAVVVSLGLGLFALNLAHIAWVRGGDLGDLAGILVRRAGAGQPYGPFDWLHKMLGFSRRLATVSGTVALGWLGYRTVGALVRKTKLEPVEEIAAIFLGAGLGYLVVFNWGAWQHHYWQFPLLPAVAIALALGVSSIVRRAAHGPRPKVHRVLLILLLVEIVATSVVGLSVRHSRAEDRVIEVVENLRTKFL